MVQQWQRNALGGLGMFQGLSFPIYIDGVEQDGPNTESLCSQEAVEFGVKSQG